MTELDMNAYHEEGITPGEHKVFNISPSVHTFAMQDTPFSERFLGMPRQAPTELPGESFEGTPTLDRPNLKAPPPWPGDPDAFPGSGFERMPFNPDKNRDDLNLYNPVADIYDSKKLGGHVDPSEFLQPMGTSKLSPGGTMMNPVQQQQGGPGSGSKTALTFERGRPSPTGGKRISDDRLKELSDKGLNFTEIGKELGTTRSAVSIRAKTLGIKSSLSKFSPKNDVPDWFKEEMKQ